MAATPASTTVRYTAAWTMFLVVTTRNADSPMAAAMIPNAMCCATISRASGGWSLLGALLGLGAGLQRGGLGDGVHPLAEPILVVQQVADVGFRVLELGAPEQ